MKGTLAVNLEYAALRTCCALVNAIPYSVAMGFADGLANFAVRVLGFKRRRTLGRIRGAFPGLSERECLRIAVASLANVLKDVFEMIRAPRLTAAWMDRHVTDGRKYGEVLGALVREGKGVVVMVPHSGNWYMAAWAMAKYGVKMFALAARQRNPKINAWMNRQYGEVEVLDRSNRDTLLKIAHKLKAGEVFAILPDLRVRHPDVEVDFLGGKANVSHSGAMFAVKCGAPIVVGQMGREGGKHVIHHLATLRPDPAAANDRAEAERLTKAVMGILDAAVRERPGDWYWYNKRWILEPLCAHRAD